MGRPSRFSVRKCDERAVRMCCEEHRAAHASEWDGRCSTVAPEARAARRTTAAEVGALFRRRFQLMLGIGRSCLTIRRLPSG